MHYISLYNPHSYNGESNENLKYFKVSQQLLILQENSPGQGTEAA